MKLFNLSEAERLYGQQNESIVVVMYDIVDNKHRKKLSDLLIAYGGQRIQKSVFMIHLDKKTYGFLKGDINRFYDESQNDNIIAYYGITNEFTHWNHLILDEIQPDQIFID